MQGSGKYTIKEIAEMTGVSRATVDRVIHGRGVVSPDTEERINRVLKKIDFKPNLVAQSLKKGQLVRIAVLMPDPSHDIYWERAVQGITAAREEYAHLGIHVETFLFNPYKAANFNLNARLIQKEGYEGIIIAPFFYRESLDFLDACDTAGIPYITFNTQIRESAPLCFVGQDLVESGKTAARLLDLVTQGTGKLIVLHLDEDTENARHMQEKEDGFFRYFREKAFPADKVEVHKIGRVSQIDCELGTILEGKPGIKGIFVTTSKVHFIAEYLEAYKLDIRLIGFDFIKENISALRSGVIDFLIFQNPRSQANQALTLLVDHLVFKKEIVARKVLPPGIVIKENLESYLHELRSS